MTIQSKFLGAVALAAMAAGCGDSAASPGADGERIVAPAFATGPGTRTHYVANGPVARATWTTYVDPGTNGWDVGQIWVEQVGTTNDPQTHMTYIVTHCSPQYECADVESGDGLIPNEDFVGPERALHLHTDTRNNPDFTVTLGSGGIVSVDWRADGIYTSHWSGSGSYSYNGSQCEGCQSYGAHGAGSTTEESAQAHGSVVGYTIGYGTAFVGKNHNMTIEYTR